MGYTDTKSLEFEGSEEKILLTLWHQVSCIWNAQFDAQNDKWQLLPVRATVLQPSFEFQSAADHIGHLILASYVWAFLAKTTQ
jgi:hypothetical protein